MHMPLEHHLREGLQGTYKGEMGNEEMGNEEMGK
jgi:hypothetical protein